MYRIVNSICLFQCGDGQHLFPEPSIMTNMGNGHHCDITSRGRKRVERERVQTGCIGAAN
jgi:hypothetical protein